MRTLALALVAFIPALAAATPTLRPPSRIDAVTVYRQGARVERVSRLELPAGAARVILSGLPEGLDDDSIRVRGEGTARARLFGVAVERVTGDAAVAAEARAAEAELERLGDEDRALEDRLAAARARTKFVESLRSSYSEERAKNLAVRAVAAREWAELVGFVDAELARAATEGRAAERSRRELARKVAQARAELEKVAAKRGATTKTVAVEVEADRGGAFELVVSYAVPAAGWRPIWDARLAPETSKVELSFLGAVTQSTGEDWSDVRLAVSTAQPGRGLYVPQLEPVYLTRLEPRPPPTAMRSRGAAPSMAPAAPMAEKAMSAQRGAYDADEPAVEEMEAPDAILQEGLLAATFTAPRRETVDGSGQARKVSLARFPLQATLTRTAAPRVEAAAFLTAKAVNDTGFPLLAGEAGVYVGDDFAGRASLPFTPPGGELELAFGQDGRVEVERHVLERKRESAGLISKDEVIRYRVRVNVKNRYGAAVGVRLLDLVPVSRDEKIAVKILEGTAAPTREDPDRPGVRIHELTLAPREERTLELRYEVRSPRGFPVAGLE
jgi:uncharacterized protein (TIGR02231 family)